MRTKTTLLVSTAIGALALTSPAQAARPFYVSVMGGANFLQDDSFHAVTSPTASADTLAFHPNSDTGFVVSAAVGMHLDQVLSGLRVEAEGAYRKNQVHGNWRSNTGTPTSFSSGKLDYDHSTWSVLANAWYDFNIDSALKPYVGGGIGWAETRLKGTYKGSFAVNPNFDFSKDGFAWQAGAGVNYALTPNIDLGVGYRYFSGPDVTVHSDLGANSAAGSISSNNQSVLVSLTFGLGT
jgi:opacity protein-like surface antigen